MYTRHSRYSSIWEVAKSLIFPHLELSLTKQFKNLRKLHDFPMAEVFIIVFPGDHHVPWIIAVTEESQTQTSLLPPRLPMLIFFFMISMWFSKGTSIVSRVVQFFFCKMEIILTTLWSAFEH